MGKVITTVRHPDPNVGIGNVLEVRLNPVFCACEKCSKAKRPVFVMLVRWSDTQRGWYDVQEQGFELADRAAVERLCRAAVRRRGYAVA